MMQSKPKGNLPLISVVTVTLNSQATLRETIESVREQSYKNWEHWIVDGLSTDGTLDIVKEYPYLHCMSEMDNGLYEAMNKGIRASRGDVLLMLNSDDYLRPGALDAVARAFAAHPEWDALFGDVVYVDDHGGEIYRRKESGYDYDILRFSGVCYVIHQALYVRRSVHEKLGLYRFEHYKLCCDYDLILRMGQSGMQVGHLPQFLVNFRYHSRGLSSDQRNAPKFAAESMRLRREHGIPSGPMRLWLRQWARLRRQWQKLWRRGTMDLVPGTWKIRRHMRGKSGCVAK